MGQDIAEVGAFLPCYPPKSWLETMFETGRCLNSTWDQAILI